jgi:hypothetical protein
VLTDLLEGEDEDGDDESRDPGDPDRQG